ncbi:hypothetical protein NR402_13200 [Acidithiobacillus ferrooxidans]|uniref:hypothetical protein n=1 Tax=Acidithiobacillus ferrooxidans TaxID=920 RepID=UPI00214B61C9|nr:hypothetical protein [Acidithiobacillus ferrooxidans]MCR2831228.1 hypothetical protein [Acidithiobacillus ferrooxidans]
MSAETLSAADIVAQARQGIGPFFPRGAVPTAEETAKARKDAQGVLDWLRANLAKHRDSADVARELEDFLFNIGSIRMLWALMPDEEAAGRYLVDREALTSQTPLAVRCAFAKAESREHEERAAMFETVDNLRMAADRLQSDRLSKAADVFESMMGLFRVEPDGPAKAGHKQAGSKGGQLRRGKSNAAKRELKRIYIAGKPAKWKTPTEAARALKKDALSMGAIESEERALQTLGGWFRDADKGEME